MELKKKFIMEFDEVPKLIFISEKGNPVGSKLLVDGEEVKGAQRITIRSDVGEPVTHEVEFVTCVSGK